MILMRMLRRIAALCLAMLLLSSAALAEAPFLRHADGWTLEATPLEVQLSADITTHMPYDDDRLAMLQAVTNNLSLRLTTGQDTGSVTICVGNSDALTLAYQQDAVQLTSLPGVAFTSQDDPMGKLLGASASELSIYGVTGEAETLLDDGWVLLNAISPALDAYADRRSVKTNITDMGTARSCTDYTVPKADAEALRETLLDLCPEGWLREIIGDLTFSGKQTLRVYRTEDEVPLRMEYNGTCGPEGNLRTVKLIWRMRRDDTAHRDEVTLTSPAKSGSNKNSLEFERVIKENKSGAVELEGSFTYTVTKDKKTTTTKGEFELTNACTEESDEITGTVNIRQKLPGDDSYSSMIFEPDIRIAGTEEDPVIGGTLSVTQKYAQGVTEQVNIHLTVNRGEELLWEPGEETLDLDAMTQDELALIQQQAAASVATAVVRPLIILMGDTADWFFRDMPAEAVEEIVDAAGTTLVFE